ncbi:MAG: UDP-glucose 4-epimerase GalE [bacterium]
MRFLVTGAAGYIGSHAALRLLEDGGEVIVVDSLLRGHAGAIAALRRVGGTRLTFVDADIRDTDRVARTLNTHGVVDAVLHFAALTYVGESVERPAEYHSVNLDGGKSLLEAMRRTGVRRMLFSSTAATYGEPAPEEIPITEATPQRPINPYGASKLAFEHALREECAADPAFGAVALRYFNVAGADAHGRLGEDHRPETHLIPICLEVALGKRSHLTVFGEDYPTHDGTCVRDYVHIEDLVEAHLLALGALEPGRFRAWNVGIGRGHSVREVIDICRRVTGHAIPTVSAPRRAGDPQVLYADARAIERDLGFRPKKPALETAVADLWRWMQANPRGYA